MRFRSIKSRERECVRPEHLTRDETSLFFLSSRRDPFWHSYFYIQYYYGLRLSDPSAIRKDDIDFEHGEVFITRGGPTPSVTVYPLVEEIRREIVRVSVHVVAKGTTDGTYLFPCAKNATETDEPISRSTAHHFFEAIWSRAGLPKSLAYSDVLRESRRKHLEEERLAPSEISYLLDGA